MYYVIIHYTINITIYTINKKQRQKHHTFFEQFNIFHNIKEKRNKLNVKKSYYSVIVPNTAANVINYHLL